MSSHPTFCVDREGKGLSVEWERYISPKETQGRGVNLENYGVLSMLTGKVRKIKPFKVERSPLPENWANTQIIGMPKKRGIENSRTPRISVHFTYYHPYP